MKRTLFIILSVVAAFLILGIALMRLTGPKIGNTFSSISNSLPDGYGGGGAPAAQPPAPAEAAKRAFDSTVSNGNNVAAQADQVQERLVIKNADLTIVVKDPRASVKEISGLATQFGGFVVSSGLSETDTPSGKIVPAADIVIRVSSEKLDEALTKIKAGAVDVRAENITGQDVTDQYVDLQAQLKAKQAAEEKLLEIMDQATRTQDVMDVYMQVQSVQTDIERLKGQIKYLEQAASLSVIQIHLIAEAGTQPIAVGPWKPSGTAKEAIQDLIVFFQGFVDFLILFVLNILPKMILIALPLFLVYLAGRAIYRRMVKTESKIIEQIKG